MNRKRVVPKIVLLGAFFIVGVVAMAPAAMANHFFHWGERMYRVTITNATLGQPVAPSVIATHTDSFRLFELGPTPAMGDPGYDVFLGIATAAESGNPQVLNDAVDASNGVYETVVLATDNNPPILLPGESNSTTISAWGNARFLSAAAMLGKTNDAFYGVRSVPLPVKIGSTIHVYADAYDAGSEANEESADSVGGADGDGPGSMTINENGEGYIFVHAGIHGVGGQDGLDPAIYDWRNPVVEMTITRIR